MTALRHRRFRWWFVSQLFSAAGTMMQAVGLAWTLLQLTGRASALGVLTAVTLGPVLLFGAWAGALIDRWDRRLVLRVTQICFILVGLALFGLSVTGALTAPQLLGLAAASGVVNAIDGPARQVYVLDIVEAADVPSAVSLYEVVLNLARISGPAVAAVLLAVYGAWSCFLLNALSYLAPLVALGMGRGPVRVAASSGERATFTIFAGLRYVWRTQPIRNTLLLAAISGAIFNPGLFFPLLAQRVFHSGASGYGLLLVCFGLGALPGALAVARAGTVPTPRSVRLRAFATGLCVVGAALAPSALVEDLLVVLIGFISIGFIASANAFVQLVAEPGLRGRVMGTWTVAIPGMNPINAIGYALLADAVGVRWAFLSAGCLLAGVALAQAVSAVKYLGRSDGDGPGKNESATRGLVRGSPGSGGVVD